MKKNYYYTPEVKFHQLRTMSMIADSNPGFDGGGGAADAKGFSSISFDEDEE